MGVPGCFHIIGLWAVGTFGECFHEQAGFLLGQGSGFKKVVMQFHWNNPQLKADYVDSSGMVLHLTKSKRTHNAGVLQVGQYYIQLSPGQEKIVVEGRCTPDMSRFRLKGPIHFTTGINHMHYLGRAMNMEHFRNGVKLRDLTMDEVYSYDSPVFHNYAESVRFEPGDEIKTSCHFKTTERSKTVFQGDGTNDEMCFGFLTYYPTENMINPYCIQWRGLDYSSFYYQETINGCTWKDFLNTSIPTTEALHTRVLSHCSKLGLCLKECVSVIKEAKKHPCLQGDMHEYFRHLAREDGAKNAPLARLFSALDSCYTEMAVESCPKPLTDPTSTSSTVQFSVFWIGAASVLRHIMK
ncbi:hypothetical protein FSP39_014881 [Pinctada imbricata]|uniref:Copper type II ascorbate-dependent monooxygenase C-terminal domain-containing protein n=1 Tax=Pinctada imbricata TaxID=66713 RepID=A0AA88XR81_PINIB|nr:hypothetical protein FSP39_014881 [Pinctada imbricata]